jgi:23S rRNA pseudouridine2605 synthase/16S rRNA pseudouridine516 synthase
LKERLQKALARAGVASRRAAERLMLEGRVTVNGEVVTRLGTLVDPGRDAIKVDGRRVPAAPSAFTYLMLNKPRGYVTTLRDPEGRPTIVDLLRGVRSRVYPIGRLDYQTEGLLLLTNDGDLARDLMRPASGVPKTYLAKVRGEPAEPAIERLQRGLVLEGRRTRPAKIRVIRHGDPSWVEITVVEGRKHQVRRMLESVGHPVMRLRRVAYGGVELQDLPPGKLRPLTSAEIRRLRQSAGTERRMLARTPPRTG